jgi:hypothetical protein
LKGAKRSVKNSIQTRIVTGVVATSALIAIGVFADEESSGEVEVTAGTFQCLSEMTPVRHFFVDNLLGDLEGTLAVANSESGGKYPPGSVVQLVPSEVMVKHGEGWNAATRDWEFFELDVSVEGGSIINRGFVDVVNQFGGNCFGCHVKAKPEWDLICEKDHGCDPIPVTSEQILQLQQADPRCNQEI